VNAKTLLLVLVVLLLKSDDWLQTSASGSGLVGAVAVFISSSRDLPLNCAQIAIVVAEAAFVTIFGQIGQRAPFVRFPQLVTVLIHLAGLLCSGRFHVYAFSNENLRSIQMRFLLQMFRG